MLDSYADRATRFAKESKPLHRVLPFKRKATPVGDRPDFCLAHYVNTDFFHISRIRRNLFIHKARIPARRFSSSISQHFKMFPPFASNEGYTASGLRYESDGA